VDRSNIYLRFFRAVQAIEDIMNVVSKRTHRYDDDIALYRDGLEYVVDQTMEMSANRDWQYAYDKSDFVNFSKDFDRFARKHFNEILIHEEMRLRR
jgi:hypothetical protein